MDVTVGRIVLDGWMFSDRFTPGMYAPKRDYRVFDLHTGTPSSLETYRKLPANGTCALRVEILEDTDGPDWRSSHSRYELNLASELPVEFHSDVGSFRRRIKLAPAERLFHPPEFIYHWGDLLSEPTMASSAGAPVPQGSRVTYDQNLPFWRGLQNRYRWWLNWLLYGKSWPLSSNRNRLTRVLEGVKNTTRKISAGIKRWVSMPPEVP